MYTKQLSVFLENREGRLEEVLEALKEKSINIMSLSLADTSDYGMLRMIVSDPEAGKEALKQRDMSAMLTDVLRVKLPHRAGCLQELLEKICDAGINIEYMYTVSAAGDDAQLIIKTSEAEKAEQILEKAGVEIG